MAGAKRGRGRMTARKGVEVGRKLPLFLKEGKKASLLRISPGGALQKYLRQINLSLSFPLDGGRAGWG
jgi:hypothetical protein